VLRELQDIRQAIPNAIKQSPVLLQTKYELNLFRLWKFAGRYFATGTLIYHDGGVKFILVRKALIMVRAAWSSMVVKRFVSPDGRWHELIKGPLAATRHLRRGGNWHRWLSITILVSLVHWG